MSACVCARAFSLCLRPSSAPFTAQSRSQFMSGAKTCIFDSRVSPSATQYLHLSTCCVVWCVDVCCVCIVCCQGASIHLFVWGHNWIFCTIFEKVFNSAAHSEELWQKCSNTKTHNQGHLGWHRREDPPPRLVATSSVLAASCKHFLYAIVYNFALAIKPIN